MRRYILIFLLFTFNFLVAQKKPLDHTVDHLDEQKTHNAPINLEYVTNEENIRRYHERKKAKIKCQ